MVKTTLTPMRQATLRISAISQIHEITENDDVKYRLYVAIRVAKKRSKCKCMRCNWQTDTKNSNGANRISSVAMQIALLLCNRK